MARDIRMGGPRVLRVRGLLMASFPSDKFIVVEQMDGRNTNGVLSQSCHSRITRKDSETLSNVYVILKVKGNEMGNM